MLPTPDILGLPPKFASWRKYQSEAVESQSLPDPRFLLQTAATGHGKSLCYMAASTFHKRTAILTSTKGLQSQLIRDFSEMGAVDIRGKANYPCRLNTKLTCDMGVCAFGVRCRLRDEGGCFYYDQYKRALRAPVVITNYAYWMAQYEYSEGLGEFDFLVLDEAHDAPDHVINHMSVSFSKQSKFSKMLGLSEIPNDYKTWKLWAADRYEIVKGELEWAKLNRKEKKFIGLKNLLTKLERLINNMDETWVWEDNYQTVDVAPIWPARFAEGNLFLGIPKIVATSATSVPKTLSLMGIEEKNSIVEEYQSNFPIENRPLIHLPTVAMNHRNRELEERQWLAKVDAIIRGRETKGIIHTVSYKRRDLIMERSKYAERMIIHNTGEAEETVQHFKDSSEPLILVSPSMTTGFDFPGDECRWQIIIKLPYPDTRGEIVKARMKDDPEYLPYLVMQQLIQATGRGVRSADDWCETFILDNNIQWFMKRNDHLAPQWFKGAYRESTTIPKPRR